jgi:hypothetical protein
MASLVEAIFMYSRLPNQSLHIQVKYSHFCLSGKETSIQVIIRKEEMRAYGSCPWKSL